jgi:hypothetical protein
LKNETKKKKRKEKEKGKERKKERKKRVIIPEVGLRGARVSIDEEARPDGR